MKLNFSSVAAAARILSLGTALLSSQVGRVNGDSPICVWAEWYGETCRTGTATYGSSRKRELEGENAANTSTSITGSVTISGYSDGIHPSTGAANSTLAVEYDIQGCDDKCFAFEFKDNPNFCEEVTIGGLGLDNSAGDVVIVDNINPIAKNNDIQITDVGTTINQLFDRPLVVQDSEGRVLACAMFKEVTNNNNTEGEILIDDETLSGATTSASTAWVFFVTYAMVIAAMF